MRERRKCENYWSFVCTSISSDCSIYSHSTLFLCLLAINHKRAYKWKRNYRGNRKTNNSTKTTMATYYSLMLFLVLILVFTIASTNGLQCYQCGQFNDGVGSITPCLNYSETTAHLHLKECPGKGDKFCVVRQKKWKDLQRFFYFFIFISSQIPFHFNFNLQMSSNIINLIWKFFTHKYAYKALVSAVCPTVC